MRSIWLASTAIIMIAGIAAAQTTSPTPTGAPNAPTETPSGSTASPGNTGTGNNMAGPSAAMTAPSNTSGMNAPAPTGAPQAAQESPNSSMSPGNMAPGGSAPTGPAASNNTSNSMPSNGAPAATTDNKMAATKPAHHGMGGMALPADASPDRYLHIASDAIKHHNKVLADEALGHAETRLLTRAVPASSNMSADDSPRISAIESARKALSTGDYQSAAMDTHQAMHGHMGGMDAK